MKFILQNKIILLAILILAVTAGLFGAGKYFKVEEVWAATPIAFPGAAGFGSETRAAYGGGVSSPYICIVNPLSATASLSDTSRNGYSTNIKQGGFKSCVDWNVNNKIIIFEVSGSIAYYGVITVRNNYTTIAGQTAPSPGITLIGTSLHSLDAHDLLIQHIRIRAGDNPIGNKPDNRNTTEMHYGYNILYDHCSFSWAPDTNVGFGGYKTTVSNSIISEGLNDSIHSKGAHSTGVTMGEGVTQASLIKNLMAHNSFRNPYSYDGGRPISTLVANNVIYNFYSRNTQIEENTQINYHSIVGNVAITGPDTPTGAHYESYPYLIKSQNPNTKIYISDNKCGDGSGGTYTQSSANDWSHVYLTDSSVEAKNKILTPALAYPLGYIPMPSSEVENYIKTNVGARPADRDIVDARIINEWKTRTGRIIDTIEYTNANCTGPDTGPGGIFLMCCTGSGTGTCIQNSERGWPILTPGTRTLSLPSNPHADSDGDGYTNLEEWIHGFSCQVEGSQSLACSSGGSDTVPPGQSACHLYTNTTSVPTGFGASWNTLTIAKEMLMKASCADTSTTFEIGNGNQSMYIYKNGYYYKDSKWNPITFTGTAVSGSDVWLKGNANYTLSNSPSSGYVAAYICQYINNAWKCGCRDANCSTPYWNLQKWSK